MNWNTSYSILAKTEKKKNPTASNGIPVASLILHVSFISTWQLKFRGTTTSTILFLTYVFSGWHWWWLLFLLPNIAVNAILNMSSLANNHRFGLSLKSSSMRDLTWHSLCLGSFSLNFVFFFFFFFSSGTWQWWAVCARLSGWKL